MLNYLLKPGVSCVSATWSYFPDANHSKLGLKMFEMCRDLFLWIQHFKRPELSVRGLVFAYNADYGRKEEYRVDIIRGEDGSMALSLKKYGKRLLQRLYCNSPSNRLIMPWQPSSERRGQCAARSERPRCSR